MTTLVTGNQTYHEISFTSFTEIRWKKDKIKWRKIWFIRRLSTGYLHASWRYCKPQPHNDSPRMSVMSVLLDFHYLQKNLPLLKFKIKSHYCLLKTASLRHNNWWEILFEFPTKGILLLTYIFNAVLWKTKFLIQWKLGVIKIIHKPGKHPVAHIHTGLLVSFQHAQRFWKSCCWREYSSWSMSIVYFLTTSSASELIIRRFINFTV